jgi:hypothetical protein
MIICPHKDPWTSANLVDTSRRRSPNEFEYELLDTGVFDQDRYLDVFVEYAKESPEDLFPHNTNIMLGHREAFENRQSLAKCGLDCRSDFLMHDLPLPRTNDPSCRHEPDEADPFVESQQP